MEETKTKREFERRCCELVGGNGRRINCSLMPSESSSPGLKYPYYFDDEQDYGQRNRELSVYELLE